MVDELVREGRLHPNPILYNLATNGGLRIYQRTGDISDLDPSLSTYTADEWIAINLSDPGDSRPILIGLVDNDVPDTSLITKKTGILRLEGAPLSGYMYLAQILGTPYTYTTSYLTLSLIAKSNNTNVKPFIGCITSGGFVVVEGAAPTNTNTWTRLTSRIDMTTLVNPLVETRTLGGVTNILPRNAAILFGYRFNASSIVDIDSAMMVSGDYPEGVPYVPLNHADDWNRCLYFYNQGSSSVQVFTEASLSTGDKMTVSHGLGVTSDQLQIEFSEQSAYGTRQVIPSSGGVTGPSTVDTRYFDDYTLLNIPLQGNSHFWGNLPRYDYDDLVTKYLRSDRYTNPISNDYTIKGQATYRYDTPGSKVTGNLTSGFGFNQFIRSNNSRCPVLATGYSRGRNMHSTTIGDNTPPLGLIVNCNMDFLYNANPPMTIEMFTSFKSRFEYDLINTSTYHNYQALLHMNGQDLGGSQYNAVLIAVRESDNSLLVYSHSASADAYSLSSSRSTSASYDTTFIVPQLFDGGTHHLVLQKPSGNTSTGTPWTLLIDGVKINSSTAGTNLLKFGSGYANTFLNSSIIVGNCNNLNYPYLGSIGGVRISDTERYVSTGFSMDNSSSVLATPGTKSSVFIQYFPINELEIRDTSTNAFDVYNYTGRDITNFRVTLIK